MNSERTTQVPETASLSLEAKIRNAYLSPDRTDIARQEKYLASIGISAVKSPDGTKIESIYWPTFQRDYAAFIKVAGMLWQTAELSTAELNINPHDTHNRVIPSPFEKLKSILLGDVSRGQLGMPAFQAITKDEIAVSPAHHTNPGMHTLEVFELYNANFFLTKFDRMIGRTFTTTHDLGKAAIAIDDFYQDHANISGYIFRELVRAYLVNESKMSYEEATPVADLMSLVPKYHHIFEVIEKGILTIEDLVKLLFEARTAATAELTALAQKRESESAARPIILTDHNLKAHEIERLWESGAQIEALDMIAFFDEMSLIRHIAAIAIADRLSVGKKYSLFAMSGFAVVRGILDRVDMAEEMVSQLNSVVENNFDFTWETIRQFLIQEQEKGGDIWKLIGMLAQDLSKLLSFEVDQHTWAAWLEGRDPDELRRALLKAK